MVGGLPAVGAVKVSIAMSRQLRLPGWVGVASTIGLVGWLLSSPQRRQTIGKVLTPIFDQLVFLETEQRAALTELAPIVFRPAGEPSLKQAIATVLSRTTDPLLAREIRDDIADRFEASALRVTDVRTVLQTESEFIAQQSRWQLGHRARPMTDAAFHRVVTSSTH